MKRQRKTVTDYNTNTHENGADSLKLHREEREREVPPEMSTNNCELFYYTC